MLVILLKIPLISLPRATVIIWFYSTVIAVCQENSLFLDADVADDADVNEAGKPAAEPSSAGPSAEKAEIKQSKQQTVA